MKRSSKAPASRKRPKTDVIKAPATKRLRRATVRLSLTSVIASTGAVLAVAFGIFCIIWLREILVLVLLAVFLAALMDTGVEFLKKLGIPIGFAILLHYAIFIGILLFFLVSFIPIMAEQLLQLSAAADKWLTAFHADPVLSLPFLSREQSIQVANMLAENMRALSIERLPDALKRAGEHLSTENGGWLGLIRSAAGSFIHYVTAVIIVLVMAFFLQVEKHQHYAWLKKFFSHDAQGYIDDRLGQMQEKLGMWIRGQLLLCLSIGTLTFVILFLLGMPYALTLSILAAVMETIPYAGPLIAAVPGVLIASGHGDVSWILTVAGAYYFIQFCENNFIVPIVMKHAVNLSGVTIMVAMMVAVSFPAIIHPVIGILVCIPLASMLSIFLDDFRRHQVAATVARV